jgi:two-component sensor histidine kinase
MPISLIINELVNNGFKHLFKTLAERPVQVELGRDQGRALLKVRSGPAQLPADFDFALGQGTGKGLELIRAMMPSAGAQLSFRQEGDEVVAELALDQPVIIASETKS